MIDTNDILRIMECLDCPVWKECEAAVDEPEDYPDGRCMTRDLLMEEQHFGHALYSNRLH